MKNNKTIRHTHTHTHTHIYIYADVYSLTMSVPFPSGIDSQSMQFYQRILKIYLLNATQVTTTSLFRDSCQSLIGFVQFIVYKLFCKFILCKSYF